MPCHSLYVHIPFCRSKCDYCGFFSVAGRGVSDEYIAALTNEINAVQKEHCAKWRTVYIGGGTPSIMTEVQIKRLFCAILKGCDAQCKEITFEANPLDVTKELLDVLFSCGVTRISCGFQSFTDSVLSSVHRFSNAKDERDALLALKSWRAGHKKEGGGVIFSADMIAGLPGETNASLITALKTLSEYGAEHISLYTLTIEENTPLGRRIAAGSEKNYDADTSDAQWLLGRDMLLKLGYKQYEVSNFCKNDKHCLHNEVYWKMFCYAGCGAAAVSSFYGQGQAAGVRYTNTQDIDKYIKYWLNHDDTKNAPRQAEVLDYKTQQFEFFMLGLRMASGVCEEEYKARFGCGMDGKVLSLFNKWEKKGFARKYFLSQSCDNAQTIGGRCCNTSGMQRSSLDQSCDNAQTIGGGRCNNNGMHRDSLPRTYHAMTERGILLLDRFLVEIKECID